MHNIESRSAIGVEFGTRTITVDNRRIKAQVWVSSPTIAQSGPLPPGAQSVVFADMGTLICCDIVVAELNALSRPRWDH